MNRPAPGVEPTADGLGLVHEHDRSVRGTWRGGELFRYVYRPWDPQLEAPRPYLHPLRTLAGRLVSLYRPHDHVWHKGIAWSLSNVGDQNFWGGRTYLRDRGYVQLANDGAMQHRGFDSLSLHDGVLRVEERLTWVTQAGASLIDEHRRLTATVLPDATAWRLSFETTMHNTSGATISFGSPTTRGRDNAGYSGLFWRGPREFTGGQVVTPDAVGGDDLMGWSGPWMAFVGRHDGAEAASTILFVDSPENPRHPTRWFVRSNPYAVVCPAPFFSEEYPLDDGDAVTFSYHVVIADGALDQAACARLTTE